MSAVSKISVEKAQPQKKPSHRKRKNVGKQMQKYERRGEDQRPAVHRSRKPKNQRLQRELKAQERDFRAAAEAAARAEILLPDEIGYLETEGEMDNTWRYQQEKLKPHLDVRSAAKSFDLDLPTYGPYTMDYTREGKYLLLGGRKGHVTVLDWATHKLVTEMHVEETVRDVKFLHSHQMFAVAQKNVYIYDNNGIELHCLRDLKDVCKMDFLPYHFLLVTVGKAGYLKYRDTSTGDIVAQHRTKLGECRVMGQNPRNAVMCLGHNNGTVTMWTPNLSTPVLKLLVHKSPLLSLAVDDSGNYLTTSALDGQVKVWDLRNFKNLHSYFSVRPATDLAISQTGLLAVGAGPHLQVWKDAFVQKQKSPYMTELLGGKEIRQVRFCPYEDVLGVSHSGGFSNAVVPGAGQANFDSFEANPFAGKKAQREALVHRLLDKIQPDMITWDPNIFGMMDRNSKRLYEGQREEMREARQQAEVERSMRVNRARGRNAVRKRLDRKRKNIIDAKTEARRQQIREEQERQRKLQEEDEGKGQKTKKRRLAAPNSERLGSSSAAASVLDRFKPKKA